MSTVLIAVVVVVVVVLIVGALVFAARRKNGGGSLQSRFGPEYDRTVAQHNGDTKAAERELAERVRVHGSLREKPLDPAAREQYLAQWAGLQERFVDSPQQAVAEADHLLAEVAGARGFPVGSRYEEQLAALSVHHPRHVNGYRKVHHAAYAGSGATAAPGVPGAGTEELREAMVDARELFDDLVSAGAGAHTPGGHHVGGHHGTQGVDERGSHTPGRQGTPAAPGGAATPTPTPTGDPAGRDGYPAGDVGGTPGTVPPPAQRPTAGNPGAGGGVPAPDGRTTGDGPGSTGRFGTA
ncbi:hypothetical protein [Streptomyces tsukubensis]|uniref:Secreted protein n=1 Tax=Streptomyces tsukubensis TaxID=83656 RepID=A0A1V4A6H1_9ACTN|nr:hypothetical protein B1H18_20465 [Streptomyces tsukubensis]QFR93338.1 hypothetical protein GBW32_09885 [Streptomyces tsukubensis]